MGEDIKVTNAMGMAEQQILGFHSARNGESWAGLTRAMCLTKDEFKDMVLADMLGYLSADELKEIEDSVC
jgi:hypothetical protein